MALIKCPECGKEISEYSAYCIGCGCPMATIKSILAKRESVPVGKESLSFEQKLTQEEKRFLVKLFESIKEMFGNKISFVRPQYYWAIKHSDFPNNRFLFKKPDDILIFKYPISSQLFKEVEISIFDNITKLQIINIIKAKIPNNKQSSKYQIVDPEEKANYQFVTPSIFTNRIGDENNRVLEKFSEKIKAGIPEINVVDTKNKRERNDINV